jgi:hypothetical protein
MVYQWKIPDLYSVSANEAGAEIEKCKDTGGFITPSAVVRRARDETSAIHGCFEWNDARAAERYRLDQAGELIRNIVTVKLTHEAQPPVTVRAFVNIKGEDERGYKMLSAVVKNCDEYAYLLDCAKKELQAFERKYAALTELGSVFMAIREVLT